MGPRRISIKPHPHQDFRGATLATGDTAIIRPIRPDDEPMMARFHEELSDQSV